MDHRTRFFSQLSERFAEMLRLNGAVSTPAIEQAFVSTPRHLFVERFYETTKGKQLVQDVLAKDVQVAHPS